MPIPLFLFPTFEYTPKQTSQPNSQVGNADQEALQALTEWQEGAPPDEGVARGMAAERIRDVLARKATELDLSGLKITTLPRLPPSVTHLYLSGCPLGELPGDLSCFVELCISGCSSLRPSDYQHAGDVLWRAGKFRDAEDCYALAEKALSDQAEIGGSLDGGITDLGPLISRCNTLTTLTVGSDFSHEDDEGDVAQPEYLESGSDLADNEISTGTNMVETVKEVICDKRMARVEADTDLVRLVGDCSGRW